MPVNPQAKLVENILDLKSLEQKPIRDGYGLSSQLFGQRWFVYILESAVDSYFYVGMTNDLENRIKIHNLGKVFSTQLRTPFNLIYFEAHRNKNDAAAREQFLKSGWGKNWIKRTMNHYIKSKKLGG